VWLYFMEQALKGTPVEVFAAPEGRRLRPHRPEDGLLAGPWTKDPVFESFLEGTAPKEYAPRRATSPAASP
jgi:membrane carboxypeptidase/penicillin-binding protein